MSEFSGVPPRFALRRFKPDIAIAKPSLTSHQYDACLVDVIREVLGGQPIWSFRLVQYPLHILGHAYIRTIEDDQWFGGETQVIQGMVGHEVKPLVMKYNMMSIGTLSGEIPVMKLSGPCEVLGSAFTWLHTEAYADYRFRCQAGTVLPAAQEHYTALVPSASAPFPAPMAPNSRPIPQHIVNTYIEAMVEKQEQCPIEMTVLTKETTVLTPCGHGLSAAAAECWIQDAHSCPVCRLACSVIELQRWQ